MKFQLSSVEVNFKTLLRSVHNALSRLSLLLLLFLLFLFFSSSSFFFSTVQDTQISSLEFLLVYIHRIKMWKRIPKLEFKLEFSLICQPFLLTSCLQKMFHYVVFFLVFFYSHMYFMSIALSPPMCNRSCVVALFIDRFSSLRYMSDSQRIPIDIISKSSGEYIYHLKYRYLKQIFIAEKSRSFFD